MDFDWKELVKKVAPTIGMVLSGGNPLVGMGIKAVSTALLGKDDGTEDEVAEYLQSASPKDLLALKDADHQFKLDMKALGISHTKLIMDDKDSARRREMAIRDITPMALAYLLLTSFIGALMTLYHVEIPEANAAMVYAMLGSLGTLTIAACAYFHGSSAGSTRKNEIIAQGK